MVLFLALCMTLATHLHIQNRDRVWLSPLTGLASCIRVISYKLHTSHHVLTFLTARRSLMQYSLHYSIPWLLGLSLRLGINLSILAV